MGDQTILPDGSAFAVMSFPLPKDHWVYKEREYFGTEEDPIDCPYPILTHELSDHVIAAIRYAIRAATDCGKSPDFDPDALVQNAVYALCGGHIRTYTKRKREREDAIVRAAAAIGKEMKP